MEKPDEQRFRNLFVDEYRHVLAYALRRTSERADAEDAVAETFSIAWRRLSDVPPGEPARLWLYGVTRRVIANQHRARGRLHALRERVRLQPEASPDFAESVEHRQEWHVVLRALARLSQAEQEVLRLVVWESLSHEAAGIVLGCSANAAAIRLHRARQHLTEELANDSAGISTRDRRLGNEMEETAR